MTWQQTKGNGCYVREVPELKILGIQSDVILAVNPTAYVS